MGIIDSFAVMCKSCGRRRGSHYSTNNNNEILIFCKSNDFERYKDTGEIDYSKTFVPVDTVKETYKYNSKLIKNARVIMAVTDRWAEEGQIGTIIHRDRNTVQVTWNNEKTYFHNIENIALLKGTKDPNLLFLMEKNR